MITKKFQLTENEGPLFILGFSPLYKSRYHKVSTQLRESKYMGTK